MCEKKYPLIKETKLTRDDVNNVNNIDIQKKLDEKKAEINKKYSNNENNK